MKTTIGKFYIIGIAVRTQNIKGKAEVDIPLLWSRFMQENIASKIPHKESGEIYCVYTEYEGDYTQPYTTVLGCKANSLENIPEGMVGLSIETNQYQKFTAKGNIFKDAVFNEWLTIWHSDLDRTYLSDFEIYGEKSQDPNNGEVDIFVGVK
ncbi:MULTISPECIES: GyrI-like domain-containing protein [unclassified Dysgonomonas]|uniref:GyrI-like domain-containing protein n=1 Tax=unclassified Dysgonomonas TaxID=2630389 RepID=UPI0013EBEF24|nr:MULTISPECIES: effector binding domain-containing protein [unclassified Dysgonomonas]